MIGMESQVGFRWDRGTIDGLFTTYLGLSKGKEHGLETWALFIGLEKAFDSAPRDAKFAVLRRYGMPDHGQRVKDLLVYAMHILLNFGLLTSQTTACFFFNLETRQCTFRRRERRMRLQTRLDFTLMALV